MTPKMFNAVKHPPKWAIIAGGGAAAAGLIYMKTRHTPSPADPGAGADGSGAIGYTDAMNMPGIVVAPAQPVASTSGDDGGGMASLYVGALGDLLSGLEEQNSQLLGALLQTGGGAGGSTGNTGGVVAPPPITGVSAPPPPPAYEPPPPAPAPAPPPPAPDPCAGMESGGSAGNCHPAGAICHQMLKCDSNSNGHYCVHKFRFADGHANCYSNYSSGAKAGQCVGPYGCP